MFDKQAHAMHVLYKEIQDAFAFDKCLVLFFWKEWNVHAALAHTTRDAA